MEGFLVLDATSEYKKQNLKCFGRQQIKQKREDFLIVSGASCHQMPLRLDQHQKRLGTYLLSSTTIPPVRLKNTYSSKCKLCWSG